jgi:hypothetical protein
MTANNKLRAQQRAEQRAERDRARRIRRTAIVLLADLADRDRSISGATFITPDGELEYIPVLRGGRA